jgi:hypothetical protein
MVEAWTLRAVVAERADNIFGALRCVNEGQTRYMALNIGEPNFELHAIRRRLMKALEEAPNAAAVSAPAGHWSWPPQAVLSEEDRAESQEILGASIARPAAGQASGSASGPSSSAAAPVDEATVVPVMETNESDYLNDPRGQWASEASASSAYGTTRYDAMQATGAPNVPAYADHPNAWCPSNSDKGIEWIELTYAKPVHATEVRVRQNYSPGTVVKLEAFALDGTGHTLWEGHDPNTYPPRQTVWLVVRFPRTDFAVQRLKVTLDTRLVRSWNQLDAVQLVGDAP